MGRVGERTIGIDNVKACRCPIALKRFGNFCADNLDFCMVPGCQGIKKVGIGRCKVRPVLHALNELLVDLEPQDGLV